MKRCSDLSYNIMVGPHCAELIREVFDADSEDTDPVNYMPDTVRMEDIAVAVGFMPSKSQARKNGYAGEVPFGLQHWVWGKKKIDIYTYRAPEKTRKLVERASRRWPSGVRI